MLKNNAEHGYRTDTIFQAHKNIFLLPKILNNSNEENNKIF